VGFFVAGKGGRAFANDVVWAVSLVPTMLVAVAVDTTFGYMLAWGGAAVVAAVFGCLQVRIVPRLTGVIGWVREHSDLGPRYLVENVSDSFSVQLQAFGVGAVSGLSAVGALRGVQLLIAPVTALRMGIMLMAVPEAARVLVRWPRRLRAFCLVLGVGQAAACLLWGAVLVVLPTSWGEFMLGSLWAPSVALVVPMTLAMAAGSVFDGAMVGLRALAASQLSMPIRLVRASAWVVLGIGGAVLWGVTGSVWGTVVANVLGVAVAWWYFHRVARVNSLRSTDRPEPVQGPPV
jgi:hypothetical protein